MSAASLRRETQIKVRPVLAAVLWGEACALASPFTTAQDYYYEFQGTFTWPSPSAAESCQSYFDWLQSQGSSGSFSEFKVTPLVEYPLGQIYHCEYKVEYPHGTFYSQGQVNRRGSDCPMGMVFDGTLGQCVEGPADCSANPSVANPVNVLTGGKHQKFSDVNFSGMDIIRGYRQIGERATWHFNVQETLKFLEIGGQATYLYSYMGRIDYLKEVSPSCWKSAGSGCYQVNSQDGHVELLSEKQRKRFDNSGRLVEQSRLSEATP